MKKKLLAALAVVSLALMGFVTPTTAPLHVPTNAALQSLSTKATTIVVRDGFTTAGDVPQLQFVASNVACSLNAGAGDNGSQVKSQDNKCWLAVFPPSGIDVRQFGTGGGTDQIPIAAAVAVASTKSLQEISESPPPYTNGMSANSRVICPAGTYTFSAPLIITGAGEYSLDCRDGVTIVGPGGTADTVDIWGVTRLQVKLGAIHHTGTGCAVMIEAPPTQNVAVLDSRFHIAGITNTNANQTGKGLCMGPGASANSVTVDGVWGFDHCVDLTDTTGGQSGAETIDTDWFDLGYLRACNVGIYLHGASLVGAGGPAHPINAHHFRANLDNTVTNAIGVQTNDVLSDYVLDVGNFLGTGSVVQFDSGAAYNRICSLPPLYLPATQEGRFTGNAVADNSGNLTNRYACSEQTRGGNSGSTALTSNSTTYWGPFAQTTATTTNNQLSAYAMTTSAFKNLQVAVSQDPGNGVTVAGTLMVNGSPTSLTCTITGNGSSNTGCTDLVQGHIPTIVAQQKWELRVVVTGTIAAGTLLNWGVVQMEQ